MRAITANQAVLHPYRNNLNYACLELVMFPPSYRIAELTLHLLRPTALIS